MSLLAGKKAKDIKKKAQQAFALSRSCILCPRRCGIDRTRGEIGRCGIGNRVLISSVNLHHGEEPAISGHKGSGTVFFSGCNLSCSFCQNYPISQRSQGQEKSFDELSDDLLHLQKRGAHNLNLVTPSHMTWPILETLYRAVEKGFDLPIVYNSSAYDAVESLDLLNGVVDIYMPDLKYSDDENALRCSKANGYWEIATEAIKRMHLQVGNLEINNQGLAQKGLLVRHLVLPENLSGTPKVLNFIAQKIHPDAYLSLMRQFFPAYQSLSFSPLDRKLTDEEWQSALDALDEAGLHQGWVQ
jgi:putative pyruvate formate lyase activating enzyme